MCDFNLIKLFVHNSEAMWLNQHYFLCKRFLVLTLLLPITSHRAETEQIPIPSTLLNGNIEEVCRHFVSRMTAASVP